MFPKFFTAEKEKKERHLPKFLKIFFIFLIVALILIVLLLFLPFFKIKKIDVSGDSSGMATAYLETFTDKNIFLVDTSKIVENLKANEPQIESVNIAKGLPGILRVKITNLTPVFVWQSGGEKYLVDSSGRPFEKVKGERKDLLLVIDNKNMPVVFLQPVAISSFVDFIQNVKNGLAGSDLAVKNFEINETTFQVDVVTKNNLKIIFDTTRSYSDQIDAAKKVYTDNKDKIKKYLDVRVEGRVYYQ